MNAQSAFASADHDDALAERRRLSNLIRNARDERFARKHAQSASNMRQRMRTKMKAGERIIVVKKGTQLGKKGIVENPEWNGRVKVKMHDTYAIKSYEIDEIRREFAREKIWMGLITMAASFLPKKKPVRKLDPAAIFTTASPATRALARRVTENAEQQKQAERIGNGVLDTQTLVNARSNTYIALCSTAFAGCLVSMLEVEILGSNDDQPTATTEILKWVVTGLTVVTIWLVLVYYRDELTLGKASKKYEEVETLFSTLLIYPMLGEMLIMVSGQ